METINLISTKDFVTTFDVATEEMTKFKLSDTLDKIIYSKLKEGIRDKNLIYTQDLRCIGKTTELIKFAKSNGYIVVVLLETVARKLRKEFNYDLIYNCTDKNLIGCRNLIIDEGVLFSDIVLEENVRTGFSNIKPIPSETISFYDDIISGLKVDADRLSSRLKSNFNDSDYKMLINNLKTTMELIQELEGKTNPTTVNISNITMENQTSGKNFLDSLLVYSKTHLNNCGS